MHHSLVLCFVGGKNRVLPRIAVVVVVFFFYHHITRNDKPHTFHLHRFQCKRKHSQPNISHALQKSHTTKQQHRQQQQPNDREHRDKSTCKSTKERMAQRQRSRTTERGKAERARENRQNIARARNQLWVGCVSVPFWFNALSLYRHHRAVLRAYEHQHEHRNNILAVIVSSFACIRFWVTFYALQCYALHIRNSQLRRRLKRQMRRRSFGRCWLKFFLPHSECVAEAIEKTQFGVVFIAVLNYAANTEWPECVTGGSISFLLRILLNDERQTGWVKRDKKNQYWTVHWFWESLCVCFARVARSRSPFQLKRIYWKIVHRVGGFFPFSLALSLRLPLCASLCCRAHAAAVDTSFSSFIQRNCVYVSIRTAMFAANSYQQTSNCCVAVSLPGWTFVVLDMVAAVYIVNCCTNLWLMKWNSAPYFANVTAMHTAQHTIDSMLVPALSLSLSQTVYLCHFN